MEMVLYPPYWGKAKFTHFNAMTESEPPGFETPEETQALKQRIVDLEARLSTLETELEQKKGIRNGWVQARRHWKTLLYVGIIFTAALLPAILVVRDRWLGLPAWKVFTIDSWCQNAFLCRTSLPSYFAVIFGLTLLLVLLFLVKKEQVPPEQNSQLSQPPAEDSSVELAISPNSKRTMLTLFLAAGLITVASLLLSALRKDVLDIGFLLAIGLYLAGWAVKENGFRTAWQFTQRNASIIAGFLIVQFVLILILAALAGPQPLPWVLLVLLALAAFLVRGAFRRIPPILWVFNLALLFFGWNINRWYFATIGDEYAFFTAALEIAVHQNPASVLGNLFNGVFVYGTHPYLSSLIQAVSMKLFGMDSFGWRFSNAYLTALAIVFFYLFFKRFIGQSKALLIALLLTASVYLLTFGKIGYNNLQAFFGMALTLWAAGWAVQSRKGLAYTVLGISLGFCFYVYPAALYIVPLPFLLILFYQPVRSRMTWVGLGLTILALLLCVLPLLFQPLYWDTKSMGLASNNPEIVQTGREVALHISSNFVNAFYSFLYTPQETHFVPVGYADPLTSVFILIGMALAYQRAPRERFMIFALLSLFWLLVTAGVSHDRPYPPTTRMFLLLPWWTLFAVEGMSWLAEQITAAKIVSWSKRSILAILVIVMVGLSLYQAQVLSVRRTANYQTMEALFLGIVQHLAEFEPTNSRPLSFLFLTNKDWGIDGLFTLLQAYSIPASQVRLQRLELEQPVIAEPFDLQVPERDTLVILQPNLSPDWQAELGAQLTALGKEACEIKESNGRDTRFTLWHSPDLKPLCDFP